MSYFLKLSQAGEVLEIYEHDGDDPPAGSVEAPGFSPAQIPANPGNGFNGFRLFKLTNGFHWVDMRTLAQAKADKWDAIKAARAAAIDAPKPTPHGTFDAGPSDQDNLNKVIALLRVAISRGMPDEANYTLADNSRPSFTLAQLEDAALAIGAATQAIYDTAASLRAQIDAATTAAQVAAISWPA